VGRRVLVVEDDPDNRDALACAIVALGHHVQVAATAADAVTRAARARFDVVLCDVGLPDLDGWTVARRVQMLCPSATIYMLTGWAGEIARRDRRGRYVAGVLAKPLPLDALKRILERPEGGTAVVEVELPV